MSLPITIEFTCHSSLKTTALLVFLCSLLSCAHEPVQLVPPQIPLPNKRFVVVRDYGTIWNALVRALDNMKGEQIKSFHKETGTFVLEPVTVMIEPYCDCGRLGKSALKGQVRRQSLVEVKANAPQETVVEISCSYVTVYNWKGRHGKVMRKETIPCISNGRFEQALYHGLIRHISP
jgi:hypothetical protein